MKRNIDLTDTEDFRERHHHISLKQQNRLRSLPTSMVHLSRFLGVEEAFPWSEDFHLPEDDGLMFLGTKKDIKRSKKYHDLEMGLNCYRCGKDIREPWDVYHMLCTACNDNLNQHVRRGEDVLLDDLID